MVALGIFVGLTIAFFIFQSFVLVRLRAWTTHTRMRIDGLIVSLVQSIKPLFYYYLALYFALNYLNTASFIDRGANILLVFWAVYHAVIIVQIMIDYAADKYISKESETNVQNAIELIKKILKGTLWLIGVLFVLSNLGINITSLVAGLGIGGIAIALALQNILSDLFSSFAIYFDKPFQVGDFIAIGQDRGVVEKIGIKTTRIRSLAGEEIVISNQELTSARIQNFKKLQERRIVFSFGVTYDTGQAKLEKIPTMVKEIVDAIEAIRFDRTHFLSFGDSSLQFEVVYFVKSNDYYKYMDANQEIHLALKKRFDKEGISFAFPTRTVHLEK